MECVVVTPHRYGIYEMAKRVGEEWENRGHEVEYVLANGSAARIGPFTIGAPAISMWWYRKLMELAERDTYPDLIWTHQPIAPVLPTDDPEFWNRVVLTIHTTLTREYELARDGVYSRKLLPYYWFVSKLEQRFHGLVQRDNRVNPTYTVVSPHLRSEIEHFGISNAKYIPNGVFIPESRSYSGIRAEYGIPEDASIVFTIGSLSAQKRPDLFAELFSEAVDRLNNVYCVVAGTGAYSEEVEQYASDHFRVLGYVSDEEKWRWFADADVFASLSAYEGMPVASAEALSFDIPVLLSDIPAHRHLLSEYGATGVLVDNSVTEIVDAISELTGATADVFLPSWEEVAAAYLDIAQQHAPPGL